MTKKNFCLTCESGAVVLISAASEADAEAEWDAAVARGEAEDRISGTTARASASDVRACIRSGHDYR